jgi:hypothetical protein
MLVSSAASAIGKNPAIRPEPMPTIQVTRTGTRCLRSTAANQLGSSPSRDIENYTRVTAYMNVHITVAIPRMAPPEIRVLIQVAARCPEHPLGQGNPELFDKEAEIAGDADADHGDNRCVLQQQIPADEPTDTLAQDDVTVGVCRPGLRDHAGELRVRQRGAGAGDASDQKRQEHPWPGLLVRHRSGEREDTGADDAAYPDRGELSQPQHTLQPTAFMQIFRLDFVDRLTSEDAPRRGAEECHAARPFDCEPGSRSILVTCLTLARCRRLLDQLLLLFRAAAAKASMDGNSRA